MSKTIAITGKGGVGKTTVSGLIVRWLKNNVEGPILALDADPDANLATVLKVPIEQTIGELREETLKAIKDFPAGMDKSSYVEAGLHQLIVETDKVDFITMGRSEGPGCYCYINSLLRKFADDLQGSYQWVMMDNEAGMEHLSRRTALQVDALIAVVNADPLSIDCARRIDELLRDLKNEVKKKYLLINRAHDDTIEAIRERTADLDMEYLGAVPYDGDLEKALFAGASLYEVNDSPAVQMIGEIMSKIKEA